jgi:CDK inhibitor PHO81
MVPALVDAIKSNGLALVVDQSATQQLQADPFSRVPKGVDGVSKSNGVLRFNESIDV